MFWGVYLFINLLYLFINLFFFYLSNPEGVSKSMEIFGYNLETIFVWGKYFHFARRPLFCSRNVNWLKPGETLTSTDPLLPPLLQISHSACLDNHRLIPCDVPQSVKLNRGFCSIRILPYFPLSVNHRRDISTFLNLWWFRAWKPYIFWKHIIQGGSTIEHKTCDILAAERLRLMRFDNRLIIDSFQKVICILKW